MGYYIVIPAPVRHANITDGAKLLYGDIAGLSKREGYCYASNAHLAEVAGVSKRTAENYLEQLEAAGLITREVEGEKSRRIFLTQKTATPHAENCGETHAENCDILIYNTNTDTNTGRVALAKGYFMERGATDRCAENMAYAFVAYYEDPSHPDITATDYKRRAATWFARADASGEVSRAEKPKVYALSEVETYEGSGEVDITRWRAIGENKYIPR